MAKELTTPEKEVEILKGLFKDNEYLLKLLRSLFFGFALTDEEKTLIKSTFNTVEIREVIRKKIYPLLNNEVPIGQVADYWMGTESNILGHTRDTIYQSMASKEEVLFMLNSAMQLMIDPTLTSNINLNYIPDPTDPLGIGLLARNLYIRSIETGLNLINTIANQNVETQAQIKSKNKLNSNK